MGDNSIYEEWLVQKEWTKMLESKLHRTFRSGHYLSESGNEAERQWLEAYDKYLNINSIIEFWKDKLNLTHLTITTEEISREQVMFPDDISEEDKYFIGIRLEGDIATIYHDRELTEEDIVHELLHIANPDKSEEWVNLETEKLLKYENKS